LRRFSGAAEIKGAIFRSNPSDGRKKTKLSWLGGGWQPYNNPPLEGLDLRAWRNNRNAGRSAGLASSAMMEVEAKDRIG